MRKGERKSTGIGARVWASQELALRGELSSSMLLAFGFPAWPETDPVQGRDADGGEIEVVGIRYLDTNGNGHSAWIRTKDLW